jgi:transposase
MTEPTKPYQRFIGCDVAKATVVVCDSHDGGITTIANTPAALAAFAATLAAASLVICEATGGYEAALLDALSSANHAVHRADARKVKAFIRSFGTLGKTDAIDARALARYGQERHAGLPLWTPREAARTALQSLVLTRQDLVELRVAFRNRLAAPGAEPVRPRLRRVIQTVEAEIAGIEAEIAALIAQQAPLTRALQTLQDIGGIGTTIATSLLALMPELGTLDRRQAAALAGLAPHPRQSGATDARRRTRGGRPEIKRVLFMGALAAARYNPALKAFYQRLRANGKKPLVALTAVMRKLIVIANARLRAALMPTEPTVVRA